MPYRKLARILRTSPDVILNLQQKMDAITGKSGVIADIVRQNDILVGRTLDELGVHKNEQNAHNVYDALIRRIEHMDNELSALLGQQNSRDIATMCQQLCDKAVMFSKAQQGLFIKYEKLSEMLKAFPPHRVLEHFNYPSVDVLLAHHDIVSVMCSLRFAESREWMADFFDRAYRDLRPQDFEKRDISLRVLDSEWLSIAQKFLHHKYHNVSHLKELGIIFIIPLTMPTKGETLRLFTLLLHYIHEISFYGKLFDDFSQVDHFIENLLSLLRGDVSEEKVDPDGPFKIRIIQRYLAKDDERDFRLFEPHINPEAEHWYHAERDLASVGPMLGQDGHILGYWHGLDFVGDFFPDAIMGGEKESLISFDLIDLTLSVLQKYNVQYIYHQQEALWNKIFIEYLGAQKCSELVREHIIDGFIQL